MIHYCAEACPELCSRSPYRNLNASKMCEVVRDPAATFPLPESTRIVAIKPLVVFD